MDANSAELAALVDAGKLDDLLERVTVEEIADVWWRAKQRPNIDWDDADFWPWKSGWVGRSTEQEDLLRVGILAPVNRAPIGADLGHVGASVLEVFINEDEARIRCVEEEAERSRIPQGSRQCVDLRPSPRRVPPR